MLASALFGGLAAGAVWCLLSLATDYDTTFLIVPLAIALAIFLRWQGFGGRGGGVCAAAATLLTFVYAQYLFAAVRIAQMLGFPLRSTLFKMDFALGVQVIRANLSAWDIGLLVLACVVATWLTVRQPRGLDEKRTHN
ncbi:MAG: hypothetical protein P4L92_00560 [Rudaea sp.]|nr:hypothetical protein [Rudaea sp.]